MTDSTPSPASASSAEHDLSGRQLGDYRVLRRIGRGAMAEVYLAEQSSLSRQVALKVLRRQLAEDASYVQRFQNEARAAAALVHANIVQIYEVGRIDDVHFIALEYVQGRNLRQLLERHGPVDAPLAATIMRQVAAALHKAAQRGIVHRDIKPENIMISPAGEVKVADFGLSRIAGDTELNLTQVGVTMGTPLYMSPEQAEGRPLDGRSDLYSFGVTCYHMLAGRPPFEGETALAVAVQHVRNQPPRLEGMRPDLPEGLCRIVHRLLEKKPDDRYGDAAQLLRDLRGLQVGAAGEQDGDDAEHWATAELIAMTDARLAATQRLEAIMKSAAHVAAPRASAWRWAIAAGVAAFLLGGVWA
ncbi:MAG: serine/threonine protein kinase, partial [Planctomycetales bacterium]|nr:serine/threonine protein kinase [Planctomycetales bacterium]